MKNIKDGSRSEPTRKRNRVPTDVTQEVQRLFDRSNDRPNASPPPKRASHSVTIDPPSPSANIIDATSLVAKPLGSSRRNAGLKISYTSPRAPIIQGQGPHASRAPSRISSSQRGESGQRSAGRQNDSQPRTRSGKGKASRRQRTEGQMEMSLGDDGMDYKPSLAHIEYLKAKEKSQDGPVPYEVQGFQEKDFTGELSAMDAGAPAKDKAVDELLAKLADRSRPDLFDHTTLARRLRRGKLVKFASDAEKDEVMLEAQKMNDRYAEVKSETTGTVVEPEKVAFVEVGEDEREAVLEKVLRGKYVRPEPSYASEALKQLANTTMRNETYRPKDANSVMEKVMALLPKQVARTMGGNVRAAS